MTPDTVEVESRGGVRKMGSGKLTGTAVGTDVVGVTSCSVFLCCFPAVSFRTRLFFLPPVSSCLPFLVPPAWLLDFALPLLLLDCSGSSLSSVELILRVILEGDSHLPCCSSESGWMGITVSLRQYCVLSGVNAFLFDAPGLVASEVDGETFPDSDTATLLCGDVLSPGDDFTTASSLSSRGFLLGVDACLGLSPEVSNSAVLFLALAVLAKAVCLSSRPLASCCSLAHSDCLSGFYQGTKIKLYVCWQNKPFVL